jgi:hypothetical protein
LHQDVEFGAVLVDRTAQLMTPAGKR